MQNDTQIHMKALVTGLIHNGYYIYGDHVIGWKAFNAEGEEFVFFKFVVLAEIEDIEYFNELCFSLRSGTHNDCKWWQ